MRRPPDRGSVQRARLDSLRARSESAVLADAGGARSGRTCSTRSAPPRSPACARGRFARRASARGDRDRRRVQRGAGDRAPAREPARARLPARTSSSSSSPPTRRPTARRSSPSAAGARVIRNPRGGKVAAQNSAVRADDGEIVAFSDANCTWAPDALRQLVRNFADPDVAYVCGRLEHPGGRRPQQGRRLLALRARAARRRVAARLGHRRQRLDLRRAARGLRRGRPALRARPLAPVPDGAARAARGVRARGERVREGDADERGRVPAQGAHVRALLGDRRRGEDAARGCGRSTSSRCSRTGICATRAASSISCCSRRTSRSLGQGAIYAVTLGLQLGLLLAALVGVGIARYYVLVTWATVVALWNYLRRGVPTTWEAAEGTR